MPLRNRYPPSGPGRRAIDMVFRRGGFTVGRLILYPASRVQKEGRKGVWRERGGKLTFFVRLNSQ